MTRTVIDAARAAFEADYFGNLPMTSEARSRNGDGYSFSLPQTAWATWWTAWQAAIASTAIPEGWLLVPWVPTKEMLKAGYDEPLEGTADEDMPDDYRAVYQAMLRTAPPTPQDPPIAALAAKETTNA